MRHGLSIAFCLLVVLPSRPTAAQSRDQPSPAAPAAPAAPVNHPAGPASQMNRRPAIMGGHPTGNLPLATAQPDASLEAGAIEVIALDGEQNPVPGVPVVLVRLAAAGARSETAGLTENDGRFSFTGQSTGEAQAYLVSLRYRGINLRSPPFRLPLDTGYRVVVHRPETTRNAGALELESGHATLELLEKRLRVSVTARVTNRGKEVYLFPEEGLPVALPEGFGNFQTLVTMDDRRIAEAPGKGLVISGSLSPGTSALSWHFELPVASGAVDFALHLPWPARAFRVAALATDQMGLEVRNMPPARQQEKQGQKILVSELEVAPGDPPLNDISISISGMPGPGPLRWIALFLSLLALSAGGATALRGKREGARKLD